jgi:hypothetical protein
MLANIISRRDQLRENRLHLLDNIAQYEDMMKRRGPHYEGPAKYALSDLRRRLDETDVELGKLNAAIIASSQS